MNRFFPTAAVAVLVTLACGAASPVRAQVKPPQKGDPLPSFSLRDEKGGYRRIEQLQAGRPLVISFFRTDCAPCKEELPHLQAMYAKYAGRLAVALILEDYEGHKVFEPFRAKHGTTFPLLHDAMGIVKVRLGIKALPTVFIVGGDGIVKDIRQGFDAKKPQEFERAVAELTGLK